IGKMHIEDLKTYPLTPHFIPKISIFADKLKKIIAIVESNESFTSEVHLTKIKFILFSPIILEILPIQVKNIRNRICLRRLLCQQARDLESFSIVDEKFKDSIGKHTFNILHVVMYELAEFFNEN